MFHIPLQWDFLFHADHKTNRSMLGTLDSSCSQVSTRQIISISLTIQLIIGPLRHGKPRQFQKRIPSVPNSYLLLSFWSLSLTIAFRFLIIAHFPSFLASFTFWTSFLSSAWSSGMRSSFINILDPFKLKDLLSMLYLWSLQLTLTHINLSLWSIIFSTLFASMRQVVSICDLLFYSSFTIGSISSSCSFIPKIMRFKALLLCSWSSSINLLKITHVLKKKPF